MIIAQIAIWKLKGEENIHRQPERVKGKMVHHEELEPEEMNSVPTEGCHSVMCLSQSSIKRVYV